MISNDPNMAILRSLDIIVLNQNCFALQFWTSFRDIFEGLSHLNQVKHDFKAKTWTSKNPISKISTSKNPI